MNTESDRSIGDPRPFHEPRLLSTNKQLEIPIYVKKYILFFFVLRF